MNVVIMDRRDRKYHPLYIYFETLQCTWFWGGDLNLKFDIIRNMIWYDIYDISSCICIYGTLIERYIYLYRKSRIKVILQIKFMLGPIIFIILWLFYS